jgi:hypothetical protein
MHHESNALNMKLTADFTDDLKPDELEELVLMSRDEQMPVGKLILNAARALVGMRRNRQPADEASQQPQAA